MSPTAASRIAFMIGDPVAHTSLPALFNAWAEETGTDVAMVPLRVPSGGLVPVLAALRNCPNALGAVITAPHKREVAPALDGISDRAARIGAVNVVRHDGTGTLTGDNTDGTGFLAAAAAKGVAAQDASALVYGCGGAGAAIALALAGAGAKRIAVADPTGDRQSAVLTALGTRGAPAGPATPLAGFDLVIDATGIGQDGTSQLRSLAGIDHQALVADVVSGAGLTSWLVEAEQRGCRVQTGAEMAAGQLHPILRVFGLAS